MKEPPLTKTQKVTYTIIVLAIIVIGYFDYIKPAIEAQDDYKVCVQMFLGVGKSYENTSRYCEASREVMRECGRVFFMPYCDEAVRKSNFVDI